jgi:hypothetical protein
MRLRWHLRPCVILSLRSIMIYQSHDLFENHILAYNGLEHSHFPNKFPDLLVNSVALVSLKAVQDILNFLGLKPSCRN